MTSTKLSGVIYTLCVGAFLLICGLCLWSVVLHPPAQTITTQAAPRPTAPLHNFGDPGGPAPSTMPAQTPAATWNRIAEPQLVPPSQTVTDCHYSAVTDGWHCVTQ